MSLTFPLAFPDITRFLDVPALALLEALAVNKSGAGAIEVMEVADAAWSGKWSVSVRTELDRAKWTAWRMALRGGAGFVGFDPGRPYPLAYGKAVLSLTRHGGGSFDGTATLSSFTDTTATINTLPDSYKASVGDRVSFERPSSQRSLHEIIEAATGNGSGVLTVSVEPPLPSDLTASSSAVQLVRPTAIFVLTPESFAVSARSSGTISFEGTQTTAPQA